MCHVIKIANWLHQKDPTSFDTSLPPLPNDGDIEAEKHRLWRFQYFRNVSPALQECKIVGLVSSLLDISSSRKHTKKQTTCISFHYTG